MGQEVYMNGYMGVWSETAGNETCLGLGCVWNNNGCRLWYVEALMILCVTQDFILTFLTH